MKIKKGDNVLVIKGKERGKVGKVAAVNSRTQTIKLIGINIGKKHIKSRDRQSGGGIVEIAMPLNPAKVMFMCSHCNKPVKLGYKITSSGDKERICKICKSTV